MSLSSAALPYPDSWQEGQPVERFLDRWRHDPHNDALIHESALWIRAEGLLRDKEERWMAAPITAVWPDIDLSLKDALASASASRQRSGAPTARKVR